tara:strand:+ start:5142 stop:6023 length:882 start_codon:yes stop_codon:yes gene_type:complete
MSTFTINTYLVDANGEYVLQDSSDPTSRIILSTQSIEVDFSLARLGQAAKTRPVLAFDVKKDTSDNWYLITNKQTLVGRFPEQSYALGALYGCFMYHSGNPDAFAFWIEDCLSKGGSSIDASFNSIVNSREGSNLVSTISNIDSSQILPALGAGESYLFTQQESLSTFFPASGAFADLLNPTTLGADGGTTTLPGIGAWDNLAEGSSIRSLVVVVDGSLNWVATSTASSILTKVANPVIDFDVDIIPDPAILLSQAEASVTNNSTGVPNGVNFTYEWYRQSAVATGITLTGGS